MIIYENNLFFLGGIKLIFFLFNIDFI